MTTAMEQSIDHGQLLYSKYPLGLNEIRLIHLEPSDNLEDRIVATMSVISLDDKDDSKNEKKYHTISYAWGSPLCDDYIICDEFRLPVTKNLHAGLKRIREKMAIRWEDRRPPRVFRPDVWADAACINQLDDGEKAKQVQLMARIYSRAISVVIWLGEATAQETEDMRLCVREGQATCQTSATLQALLLRPWFSRRWIIQETVLSLGRHVLFGGLRFWFEDLMRLQDSLPVKSVRTPLLDYLRRATPKRRHNDNRWYRPQLLDNLTMFRTAACEVDLDRVYALIGLSSAPDDQVSRLGTCMVQADYSIMSTLYAYHNVAQCYCDAAALASDSSSRPADFFRQMLILASSTAHHTESTLPSWVPNWSIQPRYRSAAHQYIVESCSEGRGLSGHVIYTDLYKYDLWEHKLHRDELHLIGRILETCSVGQNAPISGWSVRRRHEAMKPAETTAISRLTRPFRRFIASLRRLFSTIWIRTLRKLLLPFVMLKITSTYWRETDLQVHTHAETRTDSSLSNFVKSWPKPMANEVALLVPGWRLALTLSPTDDDDKAFRLTSCFAVCQHQHERSAEERECLDGCYDLLKPWPQYPVRIV